MQIVLSIKISGEIKIKSHEALKKNKNDTSDQSMFSGLYNIQPVNADNFDETRHKAEQGDVYVQYNLGFMYYTRKRRIRFLRDDVSRKQ